MEVGEFIKWSFAILLVCAGAVYVIEFALHVVLEFKKGLDDADRN